MSQLFENNVKLEGGLHIRTETPIQDLVESFGYMKNVLDLYDGFNSDKMLFYTGVAINSILLHDIQDACYAVSYGSHFDTTLSFEQDLTPRQDVRTYNYSFTSHPLQTPFSISYSLKLTPVVKSFGKIENILKGTYWSDKESKKMIKDLKFPYINLKLKLVGKSYRGKWLN
ncbi:MAG: hypothetical protein FTSRV1_gp3 [Hangzhou tipula scripta rhabdovirus 1]|nr:MAG: hypothetical protein FTSRV1_gp3 [Hangzhou tipula scripta rhabdovirus 1]